jgi:hypothetical protein
MAIRKREKMATIETGILGVTRGKIANVVGAKWKQTNYIRKLTTPANPKSPAQVTQRTKLAGLVRYVKPILAPIIQQFMDPFQKSQSGYNRFIQLNMPYVDEYGDVTDLDLWMSEGQLTCVGDFEISNVGDVCTYTWDPNYGVNGKPTDLVMIATHMYNSPIWYFLSAPVLRSAGTAEITGLGFGISRSYAFLITYSENLSGRLMMVSNNINKELVPA